MLPKTPILNCGGYSWEIVTMRSIDVGHGVDLIYLARRAARSGFLWAVICKDAAPSTRDGFTCLACGDEATARREFDRATGRELF